MNGRGRASPNFLFPEIFCYLFDGKISQTHAGNKSNNPTDHNQNIEDKTDTAVSENKINDLTEKPEIDCSEKNKQ